MGIRKESWESLMLKRCINSYKITIYSNLHYGKCIYTVYIDNK